MSALKPQIIEMLGNAERAYTDRWKVTAKTRHVQAHSVRESWSRPLLIREKTKTDKLRENAA